LIAGALAVVIAASVVVALLLPRRETPQDGSRTPDAPRGPEYAGSASCRECHERFYELWAPSHHGRAMQVFTAELAQENLTEQPEPIAIGDYSYRVDLSNGKASVIETGPKGEKRHPIAHAMGGKNVYYFLTPLDRGRLQVLPVAYDVREKAWIDTTASMVRHVADRPVHWADPLLTFNTSCHGCHVSQLESNYDPETDSYRTTWAEPGINCEACHGSAVEHIRVCKEAPEGQPPADLKILRYVDLSVEQTNATCAVCHAKARPITMAFEPGDRFFDHYDLAAFEDPDFHPDGRDLGENYTHTSWLMSPCVKAGKLSCLHCHTSSGRYRFKGENANDACLPCHQARVENAAAHHRHPKGKPGSHCVDCHMPTTHFARMTRSDHSMRPPTPSATLILKSPNACTLCHEEEGPEWADKLVREWHTDDYQAPVVRVATLVDDARKGNWTRLDQMLAYVADSDHDAIFATSLIRLLARCHDERKWPVIVSALRDASPLVRGAAAAGLGEYLTPKASIALLATTEDDVRLVRVRAASALAAYPRSHLSADDRRRLDRATDELLACFRARPDQWTAHYNLGNFHSSRGQHRQAIEAFDRASKLRPDAILPLVNASIAHAQLRQPVQAEQKLRAALAIDPKSAPAHLNLGLLLAEQGKTADAERELRAALDSDRSLAQAAFNLGIILAKDRPKEAIEFCAKAHALRPTNAKYAYTLAFYLAQQGKATEAQHVLQELINRRPATADAYLLLGDILVRRREIQAARDVFRRGLESGRLAPRDRALIEARLRALPKS
jgi:tetratricopeptide (TPR) repeat protein